MHIIYPRLPLSSRSSSFDNLLDAPSDTSSSVSLFKPPRKRYHLRSQQLPNLDPPRPSRYNLRSQPQDPSDSTLTTTQSPSLSLASTASNLERHHAQSLSSDILSPPRFTATSGIDTEFSQRSSLSSNSATGHLFSRSPSRVSTLTSDSHLINIDLDIDQYSSPPTPNRVDYPLIVDNTLVQSPRHDPRFRFFATHKITNHPSISATRRNTELQRLDTNSLQLKFEVTVDFENLNPHPIPTHTRVRFKTTPHPFITTHLNLFVSDDHPFHLINGSITFFNTISHLKYSTQF